MRYLDVLHKVVTTLSALIALIGGIALISGGAGKLFLFLGAAVFWVCLLYVAFRRKREPSQVLDKHGIQISALSQTDRFRQPFRRLAFIGVIGIPLIATMFVAWIYYQNLWHKNVVIIVANFDGPNPEKYRLTETIIERLRKATRAYRDVHIESLGESISVQQGSPVARSKGAERDATIVLWGWYARTDEKALATVHFEILRKPSNLNFHNEDYTIDLPVKELESFKIQTQIAGEMSYLILFTVGLMRYEAKDYDGAIKRFTEGEKQGIPPENITNSSELFFFRGNSHFYKRDFTNAITDLIQSVTLDPGSESGHLNLGTALSLVGDFDRGLYHLNRAIEFTHAVDAYNNRGTAYMLKETVARERAISYKKQAHQSRDPTNAARLRLLESFWLSESRVARDYARKDFEKATSIKPNFVSGYVNLGILYKIDGNLKMAINHLTIALELNPNNTNAYNSRGNSYYLDGNHKLALADFNEILKREPRNAFAHLKVGMIYKKLGDPYQAKNYLKKVSTLTSDRALLKAAEAELYELR